QSSAADLTVKAYLDKTVVGVNQQFTLHVELSGKDVNSASNPQLPQMDKFAAFLGSGSSQNIQFINGKMTASKTISYHFQAITQGTFEIGPVTVKAGNRGYTTDPIRIKIQKAPPSSQPSRRGETAGQGRPAEGDLFLRVIPSKLRAYQNEPIIVSYKIYTRVEVTSYGYAKLPTTAGFWVEDFMQGQKPMTRTEVLDGKKYTVATIRKVALFPMSAGSKTIDPLVINCDVRVRRQTRDVFDSFFDDPFFGRSVKKTIQSKPLKIEVLPLPEDGKPADFSGVVGQFTITGSLDKSRIKTNEAATFKVEMKGKGNIRTLPEPKVVFPSDFEVYPPKTSENIQRQGSAISGSKIYEYVLVPRVQGVQKIKPVRFNYFDPSSKAYRTLTTKEFRMDVSKGDEDFAVAHTGFSKEEVKLLGQDIRFIKTVIPVFRKGGRGFRISFLMGFFLIFPLLCLGGAVMYRNHLDRLEGDMAYARGRVASRAARKHLSAAKSVLKGSTQKEFYAEMGKALMGYAGNKLNIPEAGMITENVRKLLQKRGASKEAMDSYFSCLETCDLKRFSPTESGEEEMGNFFKEAEKILSQLDREIRK
ncbi:BatD family protein, partial [bacterium]